MEVWHWIITAISGTIGVCFPSWIYYKTMLLKVRVEALEFSERMCQEQRKAQDIILETPFPSDKTVDEIKEARVILEKNGFVCTYRQVAMMVANIKARREKNIILP